MLRPESVLKRNGLHIFDSRKDAGEKLARALQKYGDAEDVVILALPRGGIVLGVEVAKSLSAPLDLMLVKKIGHPNNPEYAIGAAAEGSEAIYNENELLGIDDEWLMEAERSAQDLIKQRRDMYFEEPDSRPGLKDKIVIIIDDGIATGFTMEAAVKAVLEKEPKKLVVAVPTAPADSVADFETMADEVIVLDQPSNFLGAVGSHYKKFEQVTDDEVKTMLQEAKNYE